MKKMLAFLLACALLLSLSVTAFAAETSGFCGPGITWSFQNGVLTVSGSGHMDSYRDTTPPWAGLKDSIAAVVIGNGIRTIGQLAFYDCRNLTSVSLPDTLECIDSNAFANCTALTSVTIPEGVTTLGGYAFSGSGLTSVNIPAAVKSLSFGAFWKCTSLRTITFSGAPRQITDDVFGGCTALTSVTIPEGVTQLDYAFKDCTALTSVSLPTSLKSMRSAFSGCTALRSIVLPEGVTAIHQAFSRCSSLTSVNIPSSVTTLSGTFYGCTSLKSIQIPETVTVIDYNTFYQTGLTSVDLPGGVTSIGRYALSNCMSLTSVTIPYGVTTLENNAFSSCYSLKTVTIPDTVTSIGDKAFFCRMSISDVYYSGTKAQWDAIHIGTQNESLTNAVIHYNVPMAKPIPKTGTAYASTQTVTVDGKPVVLQAYALKDAKGNPTNYVKLRDVAWVLNGSAAQFNVGWDGSVNILTHTAYAPNGSEMSTPFSGDRSYTVPTAVTNIDGKAASLTAIYLTDSSGGGYTYYQLRDLGRALGFNVGWSEQRGIFIETDKPYSDAD